MSGASNPLSLLGILPDDLRCLTDQDVKKLIVKKAKIAAAKYGKGSKERKNIMSSAHKLLENEALRKCCTKIALKRVIDISKSCLLNGAGLNNVAVSVIDIYDYKIININVVDPRPYYKKVSYVFDDLGNVNVVKGEDNRYAEVKDRKIVGCVPFGTRPYDMLDLVIKNRATCYEKDSFFDQHGHRHQQFNKWWMPDIAKLIPISQFPFGIEHYIFQDVRLHSILLSLTNDGNIVPEGKVEQIYK